MFLSNQKNNTTRSDLKTCEVTMDKTYPLKVHLRQLFNFLIHNIYRWDKMYSLKVPLCQLFNFLIHNIYRWDKMYSLKVHLPQLFNFLIHNIYRWDKMYSLKVPLRQLFNFLIHNICCFSISDPLRLVIGHPDRAVHRGGGRVLRPAGGGH